jgi:predicted metal-dependent phosphoesterase TrpH
VGEAFASNADLHAATFDRFISDDGIAFVPKHALDPVDSLALIAGVGGVCVLAHPACGRATAPCPMS